MGLEHIPFDIEKARYPFSATSIRKDLFGNWQYLPDSVKRYFTIKVVILGTESTGKTTLTRRLSDHFKCTPVYEAGRDLIPDSKIFGFDDLRLVAKEHARRINEAEVGDSPLVIIDTDINITRSYARFIFNRELEVAPEIYKVNAADLYLYLNCDADYVQDGTRLDLAERNALDLSHRAMLSQQGVDFVEIRGFWEERFEKAVCLVNHLISSKHSFISFSTSEKSITYTS